MTGHAKKFLIVSLQNTFYALDLAQVAEVGDPPQTWPIPLAPACYKGALNFHGDIVSVLDLSFLLGLPECSTPGKIVVVHRDIGSIAFLVDRVVKIISATEISSTRASENNLADVVFSLPDGEASKLDLEALVLFAANTIQKKQDISQIISDT
jgi:purine-binding chemotaxis protein CheW